MAHMHFPRLLPLTIFAMGGLLTMKSVTLVRAAVGGPEPGAALTAQSIPPALSFETALNVTAPLSIPTAMRIPTALGAQPSGNAPSSSTQSWSGGAPGAPTSRLAPPNTQESLMAATAPSPPAAPATAPAPVPTVSDSERTVLLDLRQRRQELDARETAASAREATLAAAELRLSARVAELQTLQHNLENLEQAREQREDASWQGLVKTYETMKPRDAAAIFNDLDMNVLLGVMDRMKDAKAAPVLAAMQPDKARELTTKLAAARIKRAAVAQSN